MISDIFREIYTGDIQDSAADQLNDDERGNDTRRLSTIK